MGQIYKGTLIIQTQNYASPTGDYTLLPLGNQAESVDVKNDKQGYDSNGEVVTGTYDGGYVGIISSYEQMDSYLTEENVGRILKYVGKEEMPGGGQAPIEIGDKLTKFYFDTTKTPDFSSFDWTNPDVISGSNALINIIQSEEHYNDGTEDIGSDGIAVVRKDYSSKDPSNPYRYILVAIGWLTLWTNDEYAYQLKPDYYPAPGWIYVGGVGGVIEPDTNSTSADFASFMGSLTVKNTKYQDIWDSYISKEPFSDSSEPKYTTNQTYIIENQDGEIKALPINE